MQKHLSDGRFDYNDAIQLTKSGRKRRGKQTLQLERMLLKEGWRRKRRPRWPPPTNQDLPLLLRWQNWYYLFMQTTCRQCLEVPSPFTLVFMIWSFSTPHTTQHPRPNDGVDESLCCYCGNTFCKKTHDSVECRWYSFLLPHQGRRQGCYQSSGKKGKGVFML